MKKEKSQIIFLNVNLSAEEIVRKEFYRAIQKIKTIIEDDDLSDFECVERIVYVLEDLGSYGSNKHDFCFCPNNADIAMQQALPDERYTSRRITNQFSKTK